MTSRPDRVAAVSEDVDEVRACLQGVITLAEQAPGLTDAQLRARVVALADQLAGDQS